MKHQRFRAAWGRDPRMSIGRARTGSALFAALGSLLLGCAPGSPDASAGAANRASTQGASTSPDSGAVNAAIWPEVRPALAPDAAIEARITSLLQSMSVEDKVGQLIQADVASV